MTGPEMVGHLQSGNLGWHIALRDRCEAYEGRLIEVTHELTPNDLPVTSLVLNLPSGRDDETRPMPSSHLCTATPPGAAS